MEQYRYLCAMFMLINYCQKKAGHELQFIKCRLTKPERVSINASFNQSILK